MGGSPSKYGDSLIQTTQKQTTSGAVDFDGTAAKGLFCLHMARTVVGVFAVSSVKADWQVFIDLPDPANEGSVCPYPWFEICGEKYLLANDQWTLPAGSQIRIISTGAEDIVSQVVYQLPGLRA